MATIWKVIVVFASLTHFTQSGPILNARASTSNPTLNQQQASNHQQQNGGINNQFAYPSEVNYNNEYADFQETFKRQQNSPQNSHHNKVKDDSTKTAKPIYRNQQNPQFQNYLYQKQNLHSRQKNQDSANNNVQRSSQQTYGPGQVQIEQICTSAGCRNRNDQVNSQQNPNQKALHEIQQPQVPQHILHNDKNRHTPENYVVDSNKNFLRTNPGGNNNKRANILDTRPRPLENKDQLGQRGVLPYRPHPNSLLAPSALTFVDTKNKGQSTGLVKIEYDFVDKDVNDTYETTMELVSDEL